MILGLRVTTIGVLLAIATFIFNILWCVIAVIYETAETTFIGPFPASYFWFGLLSIVSLIVFWILGLYLTRD